MPVSATQIALGGLQLFGTGLRVQGALDRGAASAAIGQYVQRESNLSADIILQNAAVDVNLLRRATSQRRGGMRAQFGASGVRVNRGSPIEVLAQQARIDEFAAIRTFYQAQLQARNVRIQGNLAQFKGEQEQAAARGQAFGLGLSGIGSALMNFFPQG